MKHEIIYTEDCALIVSDEEIKPGELEKTDLDEDEFSRDYILKEFEDFYTSNKF